jgi:hypothetical protein
MVFMRTPLPQATSIVRFCSFFHSALRARGKSPIALWLGSRDNHDLSFYFPCFNDRFGRSFTGEGSKFQQFVAGLSQIPSGGRPVCAAIRQSARLDDRQTAGFLALYI